MSIEITRRQPNPKVLRLKEVILKTGLSRSSIYAYMQKGDFPSSIKLSVRSIGWVESDINLWITKRSIESKETP